MVVRNKQNPLSSQICLEVSWWSVGLTQYNDFSPYIHWSITHLVVMGRELVSVSLVSLLCTPPKIAKYNWKFLKTGYPRRITLWWQPSGDSYIKGCRHSDCRRGNSMENDLVIKAESRTLQWVIGEPEIKPRVMRLRCWVRSFIQPISTWSYSHDGFDRAENHMESG